MKKNNLITGSAALVAVIAVMGLAAYSNAYQGDPNTSGPNFDVDRHEQMEEAFENKDFETWQNLMEARMGERVTEVIDTQEKFEQFTVAHELAEEGKIEEANQIREELGLNNGRGGMRGNGFNKGFGMGREMGENAFHGFVDADGDGNCDYQQALEQ